MKKTALLTSLILFTQMNAQEDCGTAYPSNRVGVRHIEANGIGYDDGYTSLDVFLSPNKDVNVPFLDLRGHIFNNGKWAANGGLGYRRLEGRRIYGINAYYDYRQTSRTHYNQVGLGLESLGRRWDFHLNGYLPVGSKQTHWFGEEFKEFDCHKVIVERKQKFAMAGADAEVGAHLGKLIKVRILENFDMYAGIGPYYYHGKNKNVYGGKFRLLRRWEQYGFLEFTFSYDNVFKDIYQGEIGLSFPFGPKEHVKSGTAGIDRCTDLLILKERMIQPVIRNEIIVEDSRHKNFTAINPCTGCPFNVLFVCNTSRNPVGTCECPFPTLAQAQNASKPGDIIYVFPGDLSTTGMSSGIVLKDNQQLLGASFEHSLSTCFGRICIPTFACDRPEITNTTGDVVRVANNNVVSGFTILNDFGHGISQPDPTISICNFTATNNVIRGIGPVVLNYFGSPVGSGNGIQLFNAKGDIIIANNNFNQLFDSIGGTTSINLVSNDLKCVNYVIVNNNASSGLGLNFDFNNLSKVEGIIARNKFTAVNDNITGGNDIIFSLTNVANSNFNLSCNELFADINSIRIAYFQNTDTNMTISNNLLIGTNSGPALFMIISGNSTGDFTVQNNEIASFASGFENLLFDNANIRQHITGNIINSDSTPLDFNLNNNSKISAYIDGNYITSNANSGMVPDIFVHANNNSMSKFEIQNNEFNSAEVGVAIELVNSSHVAANVIGNRFENAADIGFLSSTNDVSSAIYHIEQNMFIGNANNAVRLGTNTNSTMCVRFNRNDATPVRNAYQFIRNGASTFNLEPLQCNVGQFTGNASTPNVPEGTCN